MNQTRRDFMATAGVAGAALALGACGGGDDDGGSGGGGGGGGGGGSADLTFVTWGGPQEIAGFKSVIEKFEQQNRGSRIRLQEVPFDEVRTSVDASLEAERGPDLFRVTYNDFGFYASQNVLVDLTDYLPAGFGDDFTEALWSAVQFEGAPYGVPHHTDVSALVYNKALFREAGVGAVPERLEDAWTWDEFLELTRTLKEAQGGGRNTAFGMNWQQAGAFRWLNWLYAAGGSLYNADRTEVTLDSPEARRTLELFQTWFEEQLVPRNTTPKGTFVDELFPSRVVGMISAGSFLVPSLEESVSRFEYGATFLPQDASASTDLGGNTVVVTQQCENPEIAAEFLKLLVDAENMRQFCLSTGVLPTRLDLVEEDLTYDIRPDLMPVFVQQATTLSPEYVTAVTGENFTQVNTAFVDELERLLVNGQSVDDTIAAISAAANEAIQS